MSELVLDTSAVLGLVLDDESSEYAVRAVANAAEHGAWVPPIFWYELRNSLLTAERRKRTNQQAVDAFLSTLAVIPINVDELPPEGPVMALARQHSLTVYDAAYLELAQRRRLPIATLDDAIARAASKVGVGVL